MSTSKMVLMVFLISLISLGLFSLAVPAPAAGEVLPDVDAQLAKEDPAGPAMTGRGASMAYIDPNTGELTEIPPKETVIDKDDPLNWSGEGLQEEPSKGPAGGMKINLMGRFRSATDVVVKPDGSMSYRDVRGSVRLPAEGRR